MSTREKAIICDYSIKKRNIEVVPTELAQLYAEIGVITKTQSFIGFDTYLVVDMSTVNLDEWVYT